jgi:hypothetical protein
LLAGNAAKAAREQLTLIRIFEELRGRGHDGGYDAVRRYARRWSKERGQSTAAAYVPLSFAPVAPASSPFPPVAKSSRNFAWQADLPVHTDPSSGSKSERKMSPKAYTAIQNLSLHCQWCSLCVGLRP